MRKYKVTANGEVYEVTVELLSDDGAQNVPQTAPEAKPAQAEQPKAAQSTGGNSVKAPLTGTITAINVKPGDAVKKGQVVMILEAMKMENEILASEDGTVKTVFVSKGAQVDAGAPLYELG